MSAPQTFGVFDLNGQPKADAVPVFLAYATRAGVALTPPTINNLGGGQYEFTPTDVDVQTGLLYLIDCGAACSPRYQYDAIFDSLDPFAAYVPFDETGTPTTGAPTVGRYVDFTGTARTAPTVTKAGALDLYSITPSAEDLEVGIAYRLDSAGSNIPGFINGSFQASDEATLKDLVILIAPELSSDLIPDALWSLFIGWAYDEISKPLYRNVTARIDRMAIYLVAHLMSRWLTAKTAGGGGMLPAGPLNSVTVGKVSTGYAVPIFGADSFTTASLRTTAYGMEYLRLLRVFMGGSATVAGGLGPLRGAMGGFVI